jgi:hypothetical protein
MRGMGRMGWGRGREGWRGEGVKGKIILATFERQTAQE